MHQHKALVLVAALFCFGPGAQASVGFQSAVTYPVGTNPVGVVTADFNGDGNQDLAVANAGDVSAGDHGGISILLGNGDGTLQGANNISAGKNPSSIATADFNGDGKMDLLVVSPDVSVLLGKGDGTFQPEKTLKASVGQLGLGDFNGDNRLDLAIAASGSLTIWLGNGDGTFHQGSIVATTAPTFQAGLVVADFNGDHKLDLVVRVGDLFRNAAVDVLLGNGDGTFQPGREMFSNKGFCGLTVGPAADVNADGRMDLISRLRCVGDPPSTSLSMLLGKGDGTFTSSAIDNVNGQISALVDLDGDGKPDAMGPAGSFVFLGLGKGDGTFQPLINFFATAAGMNALATGDLNNDHKLDLVTVNSDNTLSVLLNQPGADFKISASSPNPNTVSAGQSATSTVKVSLLGAYFNNPVSLACSAKPLDAGSPNCSFDQNSLSPEPGGSATATLTIQTNLAASFAVVQRQPSWPMLFAWLPVAAFALMGTGLGSRRRIVPKKMVVGILAGLLFVGFVFQIACGGGGSSGPQVKTYTIMVTGMSGSVMHSTGMTLTVQ